MVFTEENTHAKKKNRKRKMVQEKEEKEETEAKRRRTGSSPTTKREKAEEVVQAVELKEWDPRSLPDHFFLVLEGKRRTGKSTFAKWLLQWYQDKFALVWCMTKTSASGYWQQFVGEKFTFNDFYPSAVEALVQRNDAIIRQWGEDSPQAKKLGSALIILDDVISGKVHDDPTFKQLAVEGRHHLLSIILMTQDPKAIGPLVRDNADVAVVFNQKTMRNKESIWHDFMNDVDKDTSFALLSRYAVEHDGLVCVQTNLNANIQKNFQKTSGDKTKLWNPEYCLGSPQQQQMILNERKLKKAKEERIKRSQNTGLNLNEAASLTAEKILRS